MQYCSLQHRTLLLSPVTSTAGCFCFGSIPSFFLELFLHWSPVAYWALNDLGSFSFGILSFCLSYCSWGSQDKNTEVVCPSLLQWTTFCQSSPPWPIGLGWPYLAWLIVSLNETRLWSTWSVWLVFCDCGFQFFSLSALWWRRDLWKLPDGRDWRWGNLGLVLISVVMLSKSLIQFSVDEQGRVPFQVFGLRLHFGRGN